MHSKKKIIYVWNYEWQVSCGPVRGEQVKAALLPTIFRLSRCGCRSSLDETLYSDTNTTTTPLHTFTQAGKNSKRLSRRTTQRKIIKVLDVTFCLSQTRSQRSLPIVSDNAKVAKKKEKKKKEIKSHPDLILLETKSLGAKPKSCLRRNLSAFYSKRLLNWIGKIIAAPCCSPRCRTKKVLREREREREREEHSDKRRERRDIHRKRSKKKRKT